MKKIILWFILFCLFWAYQVWAVELWEYVWTNSTLVVSSTGFTLQKPSWNIVCPTTWLSVQNDITFVMFADAQISIRYLTNTVFTCTSGSWSSQTWLSSFANLFKPSPYSLYGFSYYNPVTWDRVLVSNNPWAHWFVSVYTWPFPTNVVYNMQQFLSPWPQLECEVVQRPYTYPSWEQRPTHISEIEDYYEGDYNWKQTAILYHDDWAFMLQNYKNLDNFTGGILDITQTLSFKSENLFFWDSPILTIQSKTEMTAFKIFLSSYNKVTIGAYDSNNILISEQNWVDTSEAITFSSPVKTIVVVFPKSLETIEIENMIIWTYEEWFQEIEKCTNPITWEIFVDWELYTWNEDDIISPNNWWQDFNSNTNFYNTWALNSFLSWVTINFSTKDVPSTFYVVDDITTKKCSMLSADGSFGFSPESTPWDFIETNFKIADSFPEPFSTLLKWVIWFVQIPIAMISRFINSVVVIFYSTFFIFPDGTTVCFLWHLYDIEYQSYIPDPSSVTFYWWLEQFAIQKWDRTFIDYFVLLFFWSIYSYFLFYLLRPKTY